MMVCFTDFPVMRKIKLLGENKQLEIILNEYPTIYCMLAHLVIFFPRMIARNILWVQPRLHHPGKMWPPCHHGGMDQSQTVGVSEPQPVRMRADILFEDDELL